MLGDKLPLPTLGQMRTEEMYKQYNFFKKSYALYSTGLHHFSSSIRFFTSLEVRVPGGQTIPFGRLNNIIGSRDSPANDDDVGAAIDHCLFGRDVLLAEGVSARREIHAGCELDNVCAARQPGLTYVSEEK